MNKLNVYQINMYQNLILLYKVHSGTTPSLFFNKLKINHNYPTSSKCSGNYTNPKSPMKSTNFSISRRGQSFGIEFSMQHLKKQNLYHYSKPGPKKLPSHVTTALRFFNDLKFEVLLKYILLFSYVIITDNLHYSQVFDDKTFLFSASLCHLRWF